MSRNLYVNLPVKDLKRSRAFFAALGFAFNPQFSDDNAAALIINDNTGVMLLTEAFFATFTPLPIIDAHQSTEVLLALSLESRAEVDAFAAKARAAGATEPDAAKDYGFMYQRGIVDLDGHQWGVFHMDEWQIPGA